MIIQPAIIGIGFSKKTTATQLVDSLQVILDQHACFITTIGIPKFKKNDLNTQEFKKISNLLIDYVDNQKLYTLQSKCRSFSKTAFKHTGFGSIAEACTLALMTQNDHLLIPKMIYNGITFSIAIKGYPL